MTDTQEGADNKPVAESTALQELSDEQKAERALRDEVSELTLALVKGMLQTSYYTPDHPAGKGVALAAYKLLKKLEDRFSEVTYLVQGGREDDEIVVDGIFPDAITLTNLIRSTMGEHFAKKLRTYFQRNRLLIPTDAPPGRYWVEAGFYSLATGARLSVSEGAEAMGDRLLLGPVIVHDKG